MKKIMVVLSVFLVFLLAGCGLVERFQQAEDQYLEDRVSELMEEMSAEEVDEAAPVEEAEEKEPEATETVEETAEVEPTVEPEVTEEPTEEPEAEDTPEATEEPTSEPTIESNDPAVYLGKADWVDEMTEAGNFATGTDDPGLMNAKYENGAFVMKALSETTGWRIASTPVLEDFYVEATVKMGKCSQTDGYGIIFKVPDAQTPNQGYLFGVTCDGHYGLRIWDGTAGENGATTWLKYYASSDLINQGENETNRLGVMAVENKISVYLNGEEVDTVENEAFTKGYFGLYINRDKTENLTVYVDKVAYWADPAEK